MDLRSQQEDMAAITGWAHGIRVGGILLEEFRAYLLPDVESLVDPPPRAEIPKFKINIDLSGPTHGRRDACPTIPA